MNQSSNLSGRGWSSDPDWQQRAQYVADRVAAELRRQPLAVELPVQVEPPFHATPFAFSIVHDFGAGVLSGGVESFVYGFRWSTYDDERTGLSGNAALTNNPPLPPYLVVIEPEPWPRGRLGVLTAAACFVGQVLDHPQGFTWQTLGNPSRQFRWSLIHNGTPVEGLNETIPSSKSFGMGTALTLNGWQRLAPGAALPSFLLLRPDDRLHVGMRSLAAPGGGGGGGVYVPFPGPLPDPYVSDLFDLPPLPPVPPTFAVVVRVAGYSVPL